MDEIYCSVNIPSRGRLDKLRTCIQTLYEKTKFKDNLEILVRLDDDDIDSINLFKEDYFKQIKHLIVYTGQRVGYTHMWILVKDMMQMCRGAIIVPISDEARFHHKNWDEFYYINFKDKAVVAGSRCRFVITRKMIEQDEYIKNFGYINRGGDNRVYRYAWSKGFYIVSHRPYRKDDNFKEWDKTKKDSYGGFELQDKTILNNLTWTKIHG
jgi:hypothetical protein